MPKRIESFTDDELKAMEDRAEEQIRAALQRVMDGIVDRMLIAARLAASDRA